VSEPVVITAPWHPDGSGPVPTMGGAVPHRWRRIIGRTLSKAWSDSLFGMSSQGAFWCAVSTAPILLALLGLAGYVTRWLFGPEAIEKIQQEVLLFLNTIFNEEVTEDLIGDTVGTILANTTVISVGLFISFWAGSSAISAFVEAITIAYMQHEHRHPTVERFFALGIYLIALLAAILIVPLLAIGPDYLPDLFDESWRPSVELVIGVVYYPALAIGMILIITTLYKVAPKRKHVWYRGLPGAALAAVVFLVASSGLRLYVSYVYSHGLTYGALATPITFLLFYYFVSMAIIIGAQFNNALLEYYPPLARHQARNRTAVPKPTAVVASPQNPS
jgi:membrane protein